MDEYLEIVENVKDLDWELHNKIVFLRPYYVYNRLLPERGEVESYIKNLNHKGKTRTDYYKERPKVADFASTRPYYAALARYNLKFLEDAKDTPEFKEDYSLLLLRLLTFVNNISSTPVVDAALKYASFSRDIVDLCAKHQIPYLESLTFASQQYEISMEEAKRLIRINEDKLTHVTKKK